MALYVDDGKDIVTHSMLKTFRRCPKQAEYKYVERLKPKVLSTPLKRGTWMHKLLELYHSGQDWKAEHKRLTNEFNKLFDEEREYHGDMPGDCLRLMKGYVWHYKEAEDWKVLEVEFTVETELPDGTIYRGKCDALIETPYGLWLVDHKTHKSLPDHTFRLLDAQSALYLWACLRNKIPVQGFIWNYIRTKAPAVPTPIKDGSRLSTAVKDTDYPTFLRAIKDAGLDPDAYADRLRYYKSLQYRPGEPQASPIYRRDTLEKSNDMLREVAQENYRTTKRMNSYDFSRAVERVVERSCMYTCSYKELCATELMGGNSGPMRKNMYTIGDPQDYYQDRAGDTPGGEKE